MAVMVKVASAEGASGVPEIRQVSRVGCGVTCRPAGNAGADAHDCTAPAGLWLSLLNMNEP